MKQMTVGIFLDRIAAEEAINRAHKELGIPHDDISYIYRNSDGEVKEVETDPNAGTSAAEGAGSGAVIGGSIGALAGIATVVGVIPVIGPLFAAGPLIAALGLTGAAATTAAGAATGAIAGGLIGGLANLGVDETKAKYYEDRVRAGDILVAVYSEQDARPVFEASGAIETDIYALRV